MPSLDDRKHELDTLTEGFMVPVFRDRDPHTGRVRNGLGPADFNRVVAGYACPDCLAKYITYLATCPVCGYTRDISKDVEAPPDLWVDHLADRNAGRGAPAPAPSIDKLVDEIMADKDIEKTTLKKLKPSRWGAK